MIFVTLFCPLTTTGALETLAQTIGEQRFVVDCKVNPPLVAGHVKIIEFGSAAPDRSALTVTVRTGTD
jgi:hypothetical protein